MSYENGTKWIEMGTYCVGGIPQRAQGEVVPWPGPNERGHLHNEWALLRVNELLPQFSMLYIRIDCSQTKK